MKCPECGHTESTVMDSRPGGDHQIIRRRRRCGQCRARWTTCEIPIGTTDETRSGLGNALMVAKAALHRIRESERMVTGLVEIIEPVTEASLPAVRDRRYGAADQARGREGADG